jgi:hypothetical protein
VALVLTVIVAVAGAVPLMKTLFVDPKVQAGLSFTPLGAVVIAHFRFTWPLKLPAGVTVMVELPLAPRLAIETCVPERAKPAGTVEGFTVRATFVVATVDPEVAVTAIMYAPGVVVTVVCRLKAVVAAALPWMVVVVDGQAGTETAANGLTVTVHVRVTVPLSPPDGVRVIVEVPVAPGLAIVTGVPKIVIPGTIGALTVTWTVVEEVIVPVAASTPLTVSESVPSGVAEVLWMLRLAVPFDTPTVAVAGAQVRPAAAEEQVRLTTPVKPFDGVIVMGDVVPAPGPAITAATELSANPGGGGALTVTGIAVEAVILPVAASVPVTNSE